MRIILSFLFSLLFFCASAQDPIATKMAWYGKAKSTPNLFVHFDKTIYANNETVYFTAYLLKTDSISFKQNHVLSLALIRDADTSVVAEGKFLLDKGLAFGNLLLVDSILTGNYHFIAYTNRLVNGRPDAIFVQPVTLKTNIDPFFNASLKLFDEANSNTIKKVLITIISKEGRFLPSPTTVSYRYGNLTKTVKTDLSGQLLLNLPEQKNLTDPNLYVKLKYFNDSSFISMAIPQPKSKASVKFYPEGGNLVAGLSSTLGWEVKDQQNRPIPVKAFLYRNEEVVDTIETSSYGIGKFRMFPEANVTYKLKLVHSSLADSLYTLPQVLPTGFVLNVQNAVVNDTLRCILKSNSAKSITIRVHNFQKTFLQVPFTMDYASRAIKIPLDKVPKGITTITITDSLDRPLAERIFFAHYDQKERINITTDKTVYNQREKITMKLKLADFKDQGIVSIACVQNNRIDLKNTQDIVSNYYLTSELQLLPTNLNGNPMKDLNYLEQVLLVKGWRKYKWQELEIASKPAPQRVDSLVITGGVTLRGKNTGTMNLLTFGRNKFRPFTTDSNGRFKINYDYLLTEAGNRLYVIFDSDNAKLTKINYQINLTDPFHAMNVNLAKFHYPESGVLPSQLLNNQELVLKNNERAIQLREVVINPNGDKGLNANGCGDFVCAFNILNCPNHVRDPRNTPPVIGKTYDYQFTKFVYEGCNPPDNKVFVKVKPVYVVKEFYIEDFKNPLEPAFISTIYWNYGLILSGQKEEELVFYTSDITGKFRVVVQGILNNDVTYAEYFFEVKAKTEIR